jgi:mono/diheme cytochrome c family protein
MKWRRAKFAIPLTLHPHLNPLSAPPSRDPGADAQRQVRASERRKLTISGLSLFTVVVSQFAGCEWARYYTPPPVTAGTAKTGHVRHGTNPSDWRIDLTTLRKGRRLFARRCIECHTLPPVWRYRVDDWPKIVNSMAHRAALKPAEREAIVAYILNVRSR